MNNFQQKKIIANIKNNKDIPYQNVSDVSLKTNQNIHAVTLNNTFQQMVDNDLFNERHLIAYNNNSYGAKISADIDEYSAENGTKIFDQGISNLNSSLQIYKKVEKPLSASLVPLSGLSVNFFVETEFIDGNLIGTTSGLYSLKSVDKLSADKLSASLSVLISNENFISYYSDSINLIIATPNRIYKFNELCGIFNISSSTISTINCIIVLDNNIYIGTDTGLKYCTINNLTDIYDIQGIKDSVKALTTIDVNGYTKVLAATENSQYINENIVTFIELKKIKFTNKNLIKDYFYVNNNKFYVTDNGKIRYFKNNEIVDIKFNVDGTQLDLSVDSIYQYNSITYIVANRTVNNNENNNLYKVVNIDLTSTFTANVTKLTNNISGLKRFSKFYDSYNVFFKNNTVWYNKKFGESLIQLPELNITTDSILKFINYNRNLYIITTTAIYILTEETQTKIVDVDYNQALSSYTSIKNFIRVNNELFCISANSLIKINKNNPATIYNLTAFTGSIRYVKQLNNQNNEKFNGKIFVGDGNKLVIYDNISFNNAIWSINNVKDICFTNDYITILSNDNTIRYFSVYEDISAYTLSNSNKYSLPSSATIDSLNYHIIALNNNSLSILENTNVAKVNEFNYNNTSYSYISNDINSGNFATSGELLYFNNFNQNLYLKDGSCFALNTLSKTEDGTFTIVFDKNDTHELSTLNYVPISALNPIASINTNSIIYSRKTLYDDLTYNKYYLLFGKNTDNIISSYETKNNDLQIDSLSTLFYLETDDYNIISDISSSNVTANNVGFLTHTQSVSGIVYDTVAAVAFNTSAMYTDANLQSQKLLSGGKYFATPYPSALSTAKEDVQLEIGINTNNEITINNFRYLNKDTEGSYVLTTLTTLTGIATSSYTGIDYVPTQVYQQPIENEDKTITSYSFANNIFLYGPDGILKLNISVELKDSETVQLNSYRNISVVDVKNVLTGNIQKLRTIQKVENNTTKYTILFLKDNKLSYSTNTDDISSYQLTSINSNLITSIQDVIDFDVIGNNVSVILTSGELLSGQFNNANTSFSEIASSGYSNKKLYRTANSVVAIDSTETVFEDNHFHNTANRCFFVKQNNSITIYNDANIAGISTYVPADITSYISAITGIRYVEPEVSYFNQQTYDYVISSDSNKGLYIEDLIFNPGNLSANSLSISKIPNNIIFAGQFPTLTANINDSIVSVDTYLFATNNRIYCKALSSGEPFTNISSSNSNLISIVGENITDTIKHMFIYNGICYVLAFDGYNYKVYNLVVYININNDNNIEIQLNSTEYEELPGQYIGRQNSVEKILIIPNYSGIGYYIYIKNDNSYGIYTSEHLVELRSRRTIAGISKYYINDSTSFLVPTTTNTNSNISVYIPNSSYTAYRLNGINKNIKSFNIIDNNIYISYDKNLSSFSIDNLQFNINEYNVTDLIEVNSFLRDKTVDNTLFYDTYQVSNRFINIQTSSYQILSSNDTIYSIGGNIQPLIMMTNDNSFRANVKTNSDKYIVKDFVIDSNGIEQNTFNIYNNEIVYMYGDNIYKSISNNIYYYNGYSYSILNYNNINDVYYISENILFDKIISDDVYTYRNISQHQIFKLLTTGSNTISVGKYIDVDNKKYILEDNKKLYKILYIDGYNLCTYIQLTSQNYLFSNIIIDNTEIDKFTADVKTRYMLLSNNNIFYTYNFDEYLKNENNLIFLLSTNTNNSIKNINSLNIHEYLIATDDGLSCTKYQYAICPNVFTQLTSEIQNTISTIVNNDISSHISCYHNDDNLIPYLNISAVNVDFSDIDISTDTSTAASCTLYLNDIVTSVEFDSQTPCLSVYQYIDNEYIQLSDVSYIIKNYAGGLKEMYLNIPTTNTYYIPHLEGNIGCNYANDDLYRKNINKNIIGNPCSSNNEIYLFVSKDQFKDQPIVEINGTSLPLSIYKDYEHTCMDAENYFHSYCLQSLVSEISDTQYLSAVTSTVISNQNIATLTCNLAYYSTISANSNVKFVTSVQTIIVNNTQSGTNTTAATSYVTYTSSYVTTNTLTSLSTDQFFDTNSWRIKLRCFGTDEQSLILRKI